MSLNKPSTRTKDSKLELKSPIVLSTEVIAIATVANVVVSILMWSVTRDYTEVTRNIFKAANRPYVGTSGIIPIKDEANKTFPINLEIKNFGSVPAKNVETAWNLSLNGVPMPVSKVPDKPLVLFPQTSNFLAATFSGDKYSSIVNGDSILEITLEIRYKGAYQEQYYYSEKSRYAHNMNRFIGLSGESE